MLQLPDCFVRFYETKYSEKNLFRSLLKIDRTQVVTEPTALLGLFRYLPVRNTIPENCLFHSSYYRVPSGAKINTKQIVTLHDFVYEKFKSNLKKAVHKFQKKNALNDADGIICVSENTKSDLLHYYPQFETKKIKVIHNGISEKYFKISEGGLNLPDEWRWLDDKKYALFIGDRSSYKNFPFAVDLIREIKDLDLIIVGGKELSSTEKKLLELKLRNKSHYYGNVTMENLNILYNKAECLIYPSFYEGFGIPLIEAMKCGCPVIALNASSIPEVTNLGSGLMNSLTLEEGMQIYSNINLRRDELVSSGMKRAGEFSWDKCFQQTLDFYYEIMT